MEVEDMVGFIVFLTLVASLWHERDLEIHLLIPTLKKKKKGGHVLACLSSIYDKLSSELN